MTQRQARSMDTHKKTRTHKTHKTHAVVAVVLTLTRIIKPVVTG